MNFGEVKGDARLRREDMHFYKWLERTYPSNGKTITAKNVKDATADLRALAEEMIFGSQRPLAFA